ncbi:hypothetical protein K2173_013338 [Erythroxylum novogranatense]|uniref:Uncharacterized protein n=1 Tax=Erythroxylum novogranatense TaxID=1862640 RepID=A0AAV8SA40_9ROSI|nr:hypothetical protein K2173_013338 [Erythroxylum novogranatense]
MTPNDQRKQAAFQSTGCGHDTHGIYSLPRYSNVTNFRLLLLPSSWFILLSVYQSVRISHEIDRKCEKNGLLINITEVL